MIFVVATIFDHKTRVFLPPFFVSHLEVAKRAFAEVANMPGHMVGQNPGDFTLHHLGSFNDETAEFTLLADPMHLGLGTAYLKPTLGAPRNVQE